MRANGPGGNQMRNSKFEIPHHDWDPVCSLVARKQPREPRCDLRPAEPDERVGVEVTEREVVQRGSGGGGDHQLWLRLQLGPAG